MPFAGKPSQQKDQIRKCRFEMIVGGEIEDGGMGLDAGPETCAWLR